MRTGPAAVLRRPLSLMMLVFLAFPLIERLIEWPLETAGLPADTEHFISDVCAALIVGMMAFLLARKQEALRQERERILEELRVVSGQYRQLAENASDIVYVAGLDRKATWVSPSVTRVLGWQPDEVIGRSIASFMHLDDQALTEDVRRSIYSGLPFSAPAGGFIMRFLTKSGDHRWLAIRVHQTWDERGRPTGVVGGLTLVDDLVHARERAEDQESLLRSMSDAMFDPQVLMRAVRDDDGRPIDMEFIQANRATFQYLRLAPEQLIGKRLLEIAPLLRGSALVELFLRALDASEPVSVNGFPTPERGETIGYYDVRARRLDGDRLAITWRNVTEQHETELRLAASETRFRLLAENSSDVIVLSDASMILNWVSPSALPILGWAPEDLLGHRVPEFSHPDDLPGIREVVARSTVTGETGRVRFRWRRPDGSYRWIEATGRPVSDDGTGHPGRVAVLRDVEAEVQATEQLQRRATLDDLTGTVLRDIAFERLAAAAARSRDIAAQSGILFIDIDEFKHVNDTRGHAVGDEVLVRLCERFRANIRGADTIARMGGDEFLIILEGVDGLDRVLGIARKIAAACAQPVPTREGDVNVTLSIGVTMVGAGEDADVTVARADLAMYESKKTGRDQVLALPLP